MHIDLHTHSSMSDGQLTPNGLLEHAIAAGVSVVSITDHDTIGAYAQVDAARLPQLTVIAGIELSTHWGNIGVHVVGLNFKLDDDAIVTALGAQQRARERRAQRIAEKFMSLGFDDPLPRTREIAGPGQIGRPHFAQFLVETGRVKTVTKAFKKYLGRGKPCDIKIETSDMATVIEWVRCAGGTAVLAHPARYGLTRTKMKTLVDDFSKAGGDGLEVVSGKQDATLTGELAALCDSKQLLASCGSDFHVPGQSWAALGQFSKLPDSCVPVWDRW